MSQGEQSRNDQIHRGSRRCPTAPQALTIAESSNDPSKLTKAQNGVSRGHNFSPTLRRAFTLLLQGRRYARQMGRDPWDFAVEMDELKSLGLSNNDLRWLIFQKWVDHACEITSAEHQQRAFRKENLGAFSTQSCFVLTKQAVEIAEAVCDSEVQGWGLDTLEPSTVCGCNGAGEELATNSELKYLPPGRPRWDPLRNRLYVDGQLVKVFKLPCPNQGTILMTFEEDGWPPRIDDPLPNAIDIDPKARLRSTIKSLNRNQKTRLIRFRGDGSGEGVLWELVLSAE